MRLGGALKNWRWQANSHMNRSAMLPPILCS